MPNDSSAVALRPVDAPATLSDQEAALLERVLLMGDLSPLSAAERLDYYRGLCRSMGLNPYSKPFDYIELDGKLTLYALKNCTDQLRGRDHISTQIVSREVIDGIYVVTARAQDSHGRTEESTGAVPLFREGGEWKTSNNNKRYFVPDGTMIPLRPDDRANAYMKAETKAKRRATLSMSGLSLLDESELDTIDEGRVRRNVVDHTTGQVTEARVRPVPEPKAIDAGTRQRPPAQPAGYAASQRSVINQLSAKADLLKLSLDEVASANYGVAAAADLGDEEAKQLLVVLTWADNVRKAKSQARVDEIVEQVINVGLGNNDWLNERINARFQELGDTASTEAGG